MKTALSLFVVLSTSFSGAFASQNAVLQCVFPKQSDLTAVYLMKDGAPAGKLLKVEVAASGKQTSELVSIEDLREGYVWLSTPKGIDERILMLSDDNTWDLVDMAGSKVTYTRVTCTEIIE
jgi:hypothetical protein